MAELRGRLAEAEETLRAIRTGEVDAVVVEGKQGTQVFTLQGAEHAYRVLIESMHEGALTLAADMMVLYANQCFARMVKSPLEQVMGSSFRRFLSADDLAALEPLVQRPKKSGSKIQVLLNAGDGTHLPVQISIRPLPATLSKGPVITMVVADMTQARHIEELLQTQRKRAEASLLASEAKLAMAFASMTEAIFIADASGRLTDFNDEFVRYHRFKNRDECSRTVADCPKYLEAHFADGTPAPPGQWALARALRGETASNVEYRLCRKETGETWWGSYSFAPIRDKNGGLTGAVVSCRDVTERKELEQDKADALRLLDTLLTHAPVGFVFLDRDLRFVRINERLAEINGFTIAEHLGRTVAEVLPTLEATLREVMARILATGQPVLDHEFSGETMRAPGITRYWNQSWYPVHDERGEIMGFGAVVDETTERKRAEEELRESEAKLRDQLSRLALLEQITRAISSHLDFQHILKVVTNNLEDNLPVDFCCVCLFDEQGKCEVAQVGVKSAPLAIELALPEHAVFSLDCDWFFQTALGQVVYQPEVRDMNFPLSRRLAKGGLRSLVIAPLPLEGKVLGFVMVARREADGFLEGECEFLKQLSEHVALAYHQAKLHNSLQTAYDDLRRTQQAAMQRERLRALGQMASGITHDISNAISPVTLYTASLLEHEPDLSVRARDYLQTIHQSVHNVAETIARIREFYRQGEPQMMLTPIHLNHLAQQALDLTRVHWRDSAHERGIVIQTEVRLADDLPDIMGVESEIRDAIINLVFNAVDAMPGGGTLTLRTVTRPIASGGGGTPDARRACLELIDTGIGMDADTRRRCLDPFFTTKGEDGTGLGLAMVYGMITRHRAEIEIESTPGQGTTMRMLFPVSAVASNGVHQPLEAQPEPATQRILFIDDDPLLVKSMRDTLETDGHRVVTAAGGQEGIHAFIHAQECNEAFTVVITDLGMPYVDGRKVASAVKAASPSTPVILLTGWAPRLEAGGDIPAQVDRLLSKPPELRELREALAACCPPGHSKPTKA